MKICRPDSLDLSFLASMIMRHHRVVARTTSSVVYDKSAFRLRATTILGAIPAAPLLDAQHKMFPLHISICL